MVFYKKLMNIHPILIKQNSSDTHTPLCMHIYYTKGSQFPTTYRVPGTHYDLSVVY